MDRIPPITKALLFANILVFVLQSWAGDDVLAWFALWPAGEFPAQTGDGRLITVGFLPWQLISYGFLHGSFGHLFFNMLALFMFGAAIEAHWGSRVYLIYVLTCIVGAGLVQLVVATSAISSGGGLYPTVGASGGVFGVLLAFGMMFPERRVMLLIPPIPMKARTLVIGYGLVELFMGVTGTQSGIAHFAHLGGMLFGFLLIQYWRRRWPFGWRR
jgi:membrane associated rhomboid family serine protease